jgi:hydrogenase nickel incorporation protein HypA/HybF
MHELSVTQHVLDVALRNAEAADATRILHLYLVIGDLASIVDDSVQFYWDFVSQDTIAEGAELHFRREPGSLGCRDCQNAFEITAREDFACPRCGSLQTYVVTGDTLQLESMDIETADERVELQ